MVGTAVEIADTMQSWLETDACDGFNIMFPTVPAGLDDFVALVIPELQRRGIFRSDYDGDHPARASRFAAARESVLPAG